MAQADAIHLFFSRLNTGDRRGSETPQTPAWLRSHSSRLLTAGSVYDRIAAPLTDCVHVYAYSGRNMSPGLMFSDRTDIELLLDKADWDHCRTSTCLYISLIVDTHARCPSLSSWSVCSPSRVVIQPTSCNQQRAAAGIAGRTAVNEGPDEASMGRDSVDFRLSLTNGCFRALFL